MSDTPENVPKPRPPWSPLVGAERNHVVGSGPGAGKGAGQMMHLRRDVGMHMWSGPGRALQFHLDLYERVADLHRWSQANAGVKVARSSVPLGILLRMKTAQMQRGEAVTDDLDAVLLDSAVAGVAVEHEDLSAAETHYVAHSVMASITLSAEKADPEPLFPTDLPAPKGLIVFESPLVLADADENGRLAAGRVPIRAISWGVHPVTRFNDDTGEMEKHEGIRYVLYNSFDSYNFDLPEGPVDDQTVVDATREAGVWVVDQSGWAFGSRWADAGFIDWNTLGGGEVHATTAFIRRWILAYMRWTWQRLIVPQTYRPTRQERRRWERAGKPLEDGYVKVLRLRREVERESRGERETTETYASDHQWVVRGFWRRQWYRSLGPARLEDGSFNEDSHRLIWIDPYVAGNPDGPLVVGHSVTAAVR